MNKEVLEQIRKDYKDYSKMTLKDYNELEELERNPIVIRYKYLLKLKDDIARSNFYDGKNPNYTCEVIAKYGRGAITETNNIWCWLIDLPVKKYEELFNTTLDGLNKNSLVSVYRDLENSRMIKVIPFTEQDTFEATHKVVRGKEVLLILKTVTITHVTHSLMYVLKKVKKPPSPLLWKKKKDVLTKLLKLKKKNLLISNFV